MKSGLIGLEGRVGLRHAAGLAVLDDHAGRALEAGTERNRGVEIHQVIEG